MSLTIKRYRKRPGYSPGDAIGAEWDGSVESLSRFLYEIGMEKDVSFRVCTRADVAEGDDQPGWEWGVELTAKRLLVFRDGFSDTVEYTRTAGAGDFLFLWADGTPERELCVRRPQRFADSFEEIA